MKETYWKWEHKLSLPNISIRSFVRYTFSSHIYSLLVNPLRIEFEKHIQVGYTTGEIGYSFFVWESDNKKDYRAGIRFVWWNYSSEFQIYFLGLVFRLIQWRGLKVKFNWR